VNDRYQNKGKTDVSVCTVTLIAEDIAVTAAHCIKDDAVGRSLVFSLNVRSTRATTRKVDGFAIMPTFTGYQNDPEEGQPSNKNHSDLAILHFSGGLPKGYKTADILPPSTKLTANEPVVTAGYGFYTESTTGRDSTDGVLKKGHFPNINLQYSSTEVAVTQNGKVSNSNGDSGGPAFVEKDGKLLLVGVDNYDFDDTRGHSEVFANVSSHLQWVQSESVKLRNAVNGIGPKSGDEFWAYPQNTPCRPDANSNLARIIGAHGTIIDAAPELAGAIASQDALNKALSAKSEDDWFFSLMSAVGSGATSAQVEEVLKKGMKTEPGYSAKRYSTIRAQLISEVGSNGIDSFQRDDEEKKNQEMINILNKYIPLKE
jgi:hypothetical protein